MNLKPLIELYGWEFAKENFPDVRKLLQNYGTEVVRKNFGENVWIDLLFRKAEKLQIEKLVISDCRFCNELMAVRERKGTTIKILTNRINSNDSHASEQDLPSEAFSTVLYNDGTVEELHSHLKKLIEVRNILNEDYSNIYYA
jgi:dephospho-CoA kinase